VIERLFKGYKNLLLSKGTQIEEDYVPLAKQHQSTCIERPHATIDLRYALGFDVRLPTNHIVPRKFQFQGCSRVIFYENALIETRKYTRLDSLETRLLNSAWVPYLQYVLN
jgi:hypothetical protein